MYCRPAPDEVLELVTCDCKKKCEEQTCICMQLGFLCTDACTHTTCGNSSINEFEFHENYNNLSDASDDDESDSDDEEEETNFIKTNSALRFFML